MVDMNEQSIGSLHPPQWFLSSHAWVRRTERFQPDILLETYRAFTWVVEHNTTVHLPKLISLKKNP